MIRILAMGLKVCEMFLGRLRVIIRKESPNPIDEGKTKTKVLGTSRNWALAGA